MYKKFRLNKEQKKLRRRILEMIHQSSQYHIGSCFSVVDLIEGIYRVKKKEDKFILSQGHSAVAFYAVLEKYGFIENPSLSFLSTHPDRNLKYGIEVSTGSLGQGLPIALGMALADKKRIIYCLISDGECSEGSIWESLRVAVDQSVANLKIIVAANGFGAYDPISSKVLAKRLKGFGPKFLKINGHNMLEINKALNKKIKHTPLVIFAKTSSEQLPFLRGLDAHYYVMSEEEYRLGMEMLR